MSSVWMVLLGTALVHNVAVWHWLGLVQLGKGAFKYYVILFEDCHQTEVSVDLHNVCTEGMS